MTFGEDELFSQWALWTNKPLYSGIRGTIWRVHYTTRNQEFLIMYLMCPQETIFSLAGIRNYSSASFNLKSIVGYWTRSQDSRNHRIIPQCGILWISDCIISKTRVHMGWFHALWKGPRFLRALVHFFTHFDTSRTLLNFIDVNNIARIRIFGLVTSTFKGNM
jgi:hypothetical protein